MSSEKPETNNGMLSPDSLVVAIGATQEELYEVSWSSVPEEMAQEQVESERTAIKKAMTLIKEEEAAQERWRPWANKWVYDRPPFTVRWTIYFLEWKHRVEKQMDSLKKKAKKAKEAVNEQG